MISCDRQASLHYESNGKRYPSVSQILDVLFPCRFRFVDPMILEEARQRGERRHLLFGLLALWRADLADYPVIEERDKPFADGLLTWIIAHEVRPLMVEEPAICEKYGYAGRPDGKFLYGRQRTVLLPDLKTGVQEEAHKVQVQAYWKLPGYTDAQVLMELYVNDDGKVTEKPVTPSPHDHAFFLCGLGVVKGRVSRGL